MGHRGKNIQAFFKRFCSNSFLPACFYTLIHLTYFEYFKILEMSSSPPPPPIRFLLFDIGRCIPNQNKNPNYIKLDITCNIEESESDTACNITPIPVSFVHYSLRFPFFILKIDQNFTDINILFCFYFFPQNIEMKSTSIFSFKKLWCTKSNEHCRMIISQTWNIHIYIQFSVRSNVRFSLNDEKAFRINTRVSVKVFGEVTDSRRDVNHQ